MSRKITVKLTEEDVKNALIKYVNDSFDISGFEVDRIVYSTENYKGLNNEAVSVRVLVHCTEGWGGISE